MEQENKGWILATKYTGHSELAISKRWANFRERLARVRKQIEI